MTTERDKPSTFCFVRHGETDWNVALRMQGQIDLDLNANGLAQALAVGRYFAGRQASVLYSSDLLRARQTAQPAADVLRLPMNLLPGLRERHFGRCEGLTFEEIKVRYPDDAAAIISRDPDYISPGGESRRQHERRILDSVGQLISLHPGQTVVAVTHGGVLDVIYRYVNDLPSDAPRDYPIPNAGINWVTIGADGWKIDEWGGVAHLA